MAELSPGLHLLESTGSDSESSFSTKQSIHDEEAEFYGQDGADAAAYSGEEYRPELREGLQDREDQITALPWAAGSGTHLRPIATTCIDQSHRRNVDCPSHPHETMAELPDERQLVLRARSRLDQWTRDARMEAYTELFESDDPILSPEEVQLLDALDSELERQGGDGLWGTDQYGIHTAGASSSDAPLGVVCVYHPQITTDSVLRGADELDDETEERLNAALWEYSERVATLIDAKLQEFIRQTQS